MKTSNEYLDTLRVHFGATSDYQLTKFIPHLSRARISSYRIGKSRFDDYMCAQVADILGLDKLEVIADINAERESRPHVKSYWENLANNIRNAAAVVVVGVIGLAISPSADAGTLSAAQAAQHCILCKIIRRLLNCIMPPLSPGYTAA